MKGMSYGRFGLTMIVSFFIMYIVMFLNIDKAEHYHTSTTRIYMALLMIAPMAIVMMLMMGKMYANKRTNALIMIAGAVVFVLVLIGLRTQTPIGDIQYMKAMIPHHSSAIMVSKHANIKDPEVKKLSEQIIQSQEKEIAEMEAKIKELSK
ncbi:MAG: DUF305 domain-containing protein [Gammaproteobacteria bacterium]|nr:MAG: DUF305 domain-containing protein [Gammaproteobacteria bacterium]